jgi:hypothetical protein
MNIGKPRRVIRVEPLKHPVPDEFRPATPKPEPAPKEPAVTST